MFDEAFSWWSSQSLKLPESKEPEEEVEQRFEEQGGESPLLKEAEEE